MKKLFCILLTAILCLALVPAVFAADTVVYVNDGGTGDGSSAAKPLGSLEEAINKIAATGGTVKVVETITLVKNKDNIHPSATAAMSIFKEPAHQNPITITSADPAKKASILYSGSCTDYSLSGPTTFENIKFDSGEWTDSVYIEAQGFHLTMGEGLEMVDTTGENVYATTRLCVFGLCFAGNTFDGYLTSDSWLTFKSGVYSVICPGTQNVTASVEGEKLTGTFYVEFLGPISVNELGFATWGGADQIECTRSIVTWASELSVWRMFLGYNYSAKLTNSTTFLVKDGAKMTIHPKAAANTQGYVGLAKITELNVYYDDTSDTATETATALGRVLLSRGDVLKRTLKEYTGKATPGTEIKMTVNSTLAYVNGEAKTLDAAPIIRQNRTMLPVRFVAENLGATVGWDGATSTATVTGNGVVIEITIGATTAKVNGEAVDLDSPAFIENSRTYLPVRFVAEKLGGNVAWDGTTSTATITK